MTQHFRVTHYYSHVMNFSLQLINRNIGSGNDGFYKTFTIIALASTSNPKSGLGVIKCIPGYRQSVRSRLKTSIDSPVSHQWFEVYFPVRY